MTETNLPFIGWFLHLGRLSSGAVCLCEWSSGVRGLISRAIRGPTYTLLYLVRTAWGSAEFAGSLTIFQLYHTVVQSTYFSPLEYGKVTSKSTHDK